MMTAESLPWLSIESLSRQYRARALSPVEVTKAVLKRIGELNPILKSHLLVLGEAAQREAEDSERRYRAGDPRGPLDGVPVSVKDLFDIAGLPTTAASRVPKIPAAKADSTVVARLRDAGAVLIAKNNQHELAYGPTGTSSAFGAALNPWNRAHMPGGSSSGSAASVAAGMSFASVGSETGASVRRPASFCGVVGFKPTAGRISRYGMLTGSWTLDAVGGFARTVSGAAALVKALAGHDPLDPWSSRREYPDFDADDAKVSGMRIGVPRAYLTDVDNDARYAVEAALQAFSKLGAKVSDIELPGLRFAAVTSSLISATEITAFHRRWIRERPQDYGDDVRGKIYLGEGIAAGEYLLGQRARRLMGAEVLAAFSNVDLIVSPTAPGGAPRIEEGIRGVKDRPFEAGDHHCNLVRLPSVFGLPTVSVPCGWDRRGMPLGLQLVARPYFEETVIRAARAFEIVAPWADRRPKDLTVN